MDILKGLIFPKNQLKYLLLNRRFALVTIISVVITIFVLFFENSYTIFLNTYFQFIDSVSGTILRILLNQNIITVLAVSGTENLMYLKPGVILLVLVLLSFNYSYKKALSFSVVFISYILLLHIVLIASFSLAYYLWGVELNFNHRAFYKILLLLYFFTVQRIYRKQIIETPQNLLTIKNLLYRYFEFLLLFNLFQFIVSIFSEPRLVGAFLIIIQFFSDVALDFLGYNTLINGFKVYNETSHVYIAYSCIGVKIMYVFSLFIFLSNRTTNSKVFYTLFGLVVLLFLNILRIVLLFVHVSENTSYNKIMNLHHEIYNWVIYFSIGVLWFIWFNRKNKALKSKMNYPGAKSRSSSFSSLFNL